MIFLFYLVIAEFFFLKFKNCGAHSPKKNPDIKKKNQDITFVTAFFCRIGHKTWLSLLITETFVLFGGWVVGGG